MHITGNRNIVLSVDGNGGIIRSRKRDGQPHLFARKGLPEGEVC